MTNPSNIVRVRSRNGGHASVYETNLWAQKWPQGLFSGNGVLENTSPNMNVLVGGTPSKPDVVIAQNPSGNKIALDIVGQQAVLITAPASNSRISSIVAYTDDLSLASTDPSTTGSPSSCGLIVVNGTTAASPVAPTDSQIRTAITADGATGSQAAYVVIANIPVASTTTTITNALISLQRSLLTSSEINFGGSGSGIWWEEIGRTVLSTAGDTISVTSIPARKYLSFTTTLLAQDGPVDGLMRFNNDLTSSYNYRISDNGGADSVGPSTDILIVAAPGSTTQPQYCEGMILNIANQEKLYIGHTVSAGNAVGAAAVTNRREQQGKWANTSTQINRIDIINTSAGNFAPGSELIIRGHN